MPDDARSFEASAEPFDVTPEPAERPAPTGRSSRTRLVVLGSVAALALAALGALGTAGWRIAQQKDAELQTPGQVAGLTRDDGEEAAATADYLRTAIAAEVQLDESIAAVYADPAADDRSVLLFGGTALLWRPERDLDRAFDLVADDGGEVTGVRDVAAGGLGGTMRCGSAGGDDLELTVCGWADHGSLAVAMFPGRDLDGSAELMRQIRDDVQSRN